MQKTNLEQLKDSFPQLIDFLTPLPSSVRKSIMEGAKTYFQEMDQSLEPLIEEEPESLTTNELDDIKENLDSLLKLKGKNLSSLTKIKFLKWQEEWFKFRDFDLR